MKRPARRACRSGHDDLHRLRPALHRLAHRVALLRRDQRAHRGRRVARVADDDRLELRAQRLLDVCT
jgi:hypothetical protein